MSARRTSRRTLIKQAAAASAGVLAFPYFVPGSALGKDGAVAPSNRLVMGCIGTGGQGRGNMGAFLNMPDVQVVAVCDVDAGRCAQARDQVNAKYGNADCKEYRDYRELLRREDINLVSIGTPDHWHALNAVDAARAGKDIYCEKPLANSVAESKAIRDAVKKYNRVLQCGSHERSNPNARFAAELVRNGRIGKLHTIEINLPCSDEHHLKAQQLNQEPHPELPIPEDFDYDFWLGHTEKVPYSKYRTHFWWRFNLRYGGGEMTDRGAHVIDLGQLGNATDDTGPTEIIARGQRDPKAFFNSFFTYEFENRFANGVKMVGKTQDPRGLKFIGDEGWIFVHVHGCKLEAEPASLLEAKIGDGEIQLGRTDSHHLNFIEAVKTRGVPFASAEVGHRTATICHLNNIAMILGRPLKWDPVAEKVIGDDEANRMLMPPMRAPWKLEV